MDNELSMLWRARKTTHALLIARGYSLAQSDLLMDIDEFRQRYADPSNNQSVSQREQLTILASHSLDPKNQIFVFWADEEKIGVKPIKNYVTRMEKENITRAILILKKGITTFARRILQEMAHPADPNALRRHIELFEDQELLVNITEHSFVPKHQVLTDQEKKDLLIKYKLKETQLPRMQSVDPIARFFGLNKGQVVKITRPSETAGRYVTYRLCV